MTREEAVTWAGSVFVVLSMLAAAGVIGLGLALFFVGLGIH